jgi:teichuronic acid exporter
MTESLKTKALNALAWSFVESVGQQSVQFVIGIVLARLLFPEQFGLISMITIFMGLAQSFLDSGFGAALIQKREVTHTDTCSIFFFNIIVGLLAAGFLCLLAPWISEFYDQPILKPLTMALSLIIVINSIGLIQSTILSKQINFRTQTMVSLIASLLSGGIGVILAMKGFGVWSLAIQQISRAFFNTLLLWFLNDWRPAMIFSLTSLRTMFSFGSRLLASGLLNKIFDNIYLLVIGKIFSATDLGLFTRAQGLQEISSQTLSSMVGRVTFPVFSTMQDDTARLKRGMRNALTILCFLNFPMMVGLAIVARPLVLVLLTEKWAGCIPYLQLLCFYGLLFPVHLINLSILQALGRSNLFLRIEIIKKVLIVINIAVTWQWGISAMICGMIVFSVICFYINGYYIGPLIGYSVLEQMRDLLCYFIAAVFMGMAVYGIGLMRFQQYLNMLMAQIITGISVYYFICRLFQFPAFKNIMEIISEQRKEIHI